MLFRSPPPLERVPRGHGGQGGCPRRTDPHLPHFFFLPLLSRSSLCPPPRPTPPAAARRRIAIIQGRPELIDTGRKLGRVLFSLLVQGIEPGTSASPPASSTPPAPCRAPPARFPAILAASHLADPTSELKGELPSLIGLSCPPSPSHRRTTVACVAAASHRRRAVSRPRPRPGPARRPAGSEACPAWPRSGQARRPAPSGSWPAWGPVWAGSEAGLLWHWPGLHPGLGRPLGRPAQ